MADNNTTQFQQIYDIKFQIGDIDFTPTTYRVEVVSSIYFAFNVFLIAFREESGKVLTEEIFGQNEAKLTISRTSANKKNEAEEILDATLLILKVKFPVTPKEDPRPSEKESSRQPRKITLLCIPKNAFSMMYTNVNLLIENNSILNIDGVDLPPTPLNIVRLMAQEFLSKKQALISNRNENPEPLLQLLIPPTNLIEAVRYINNKYSLYRGGSIPFISSQIREDGLKLCIWDLRGKLAGTQDYSITLLSPGALITEFPYSEVEMAPGEERDEPSNYYIFTSIKTLYKGNQRIIKSAYSNTFVTHPPTELFENIDLNIEDIFKENSLTDKKSKLQFDSALKKLRTVHSNVSLSSPFNTVPKEFLSSKIMDLSEISFTINSGNLPFIKLTRAGIKIELKTHLATKESGSDSGYAAYTGSYIVKKSYLTWTRGTGTIHYQCNALVNCIRGFYT